VKPENILLTPLALTATPPSGSQGLAVVAAARQHARSLAEGLTRGSTNAAVAAAGLRDYIVRLCDFGCALIAPEGADLSAVRGASGKGSTMYCAPEVYQAFVAARDAVSMRATCIHAAFMNHSVFLVAEPDAAAVA